jgi:hypothetical protein
MTPSAYPFSGPARFVARAARGCSTAIAALYLATALGAQGALTPPPGAPAPEMKTLQQVEPRTPIASVPFTINAPGSYYLTGNLQFTAPTGDAIVVAASDVVLDLGGFTLSSANVVGGDGISLVAGMRNVTVRNGQIAGKTVVTVSGTFPNREWSVAPAGFRVGVAATAAGVENVRLQDLTVTGCRLVGIELSAPGAIIERCLVSSNGAAGLSALQATVLSCTARQNFGPGFFVSSSRLQSCDARDNGGAGFFGNDAIFDHCTAAANGSTGFLGNGGSRSGCVATGNQGSGFNGNLSAFHRCTATANALAGFDVNGASISNSVASNNTGNGFIALNSAITHSVALGNSGAGFNLAGGTLSFCTAFAHSTNILATATTRTGNNPGP